MKILYYFGNLVVVAFIVVGLVAPCSAKAAPARTWHLVLLVYSTDHGHMLALDSYAARFALPGSYATERECDAAGDAILPGFKSAVLPDGTRLLPAYACEVNW